MLMKTTREPSALTTTSVSHLKDEPNKYLHLIDLRVQQRNGRKTLTTLQGLPKEIDSKRLLKAVKKAFACNGTVVEDEEHGEIIQMQGDQRFKMAEFLVSEGIAKKADIKVHGF